MSSLDDYIDDFRTTSPFGPGRPIFLNSAGSSLPDPKVVTTIAEHVALESTVGGYEAAQGAEAEIERFYESAAQLINGESAGIAYMDSGTRAWNTAIYAAPDLGPDTEIITATSEFGSNLVSLAHLAQRTGATIKLVDLTPDGGLDLDHLHALINNKTRLVALSLINAHIGTVNDLTGIGDLLHDRSPDALFVADAAQAVGHVPVDVQALGADALTATGRKWLRGPRGSAFLYVAPSRVHHLAPVAYDQVIAGLEAPGAYPNTKLTVREDARRFEMWERSHATMLGLGAAIDVALELGIERSQARIAPVATHLRAGIASIDRLRVLDAPDARTGIVGVASDDRSVWDLVAGLKTAGVQAGGMPRWETGPTFGGPSHRSVLRISPHFFNTEAEIETAINRLASLAQSIARK